MRLEGASVTLRDAYAELPSVFVDLAVIVTDLGGMTFLMVYVSMLYWLTRRREAALVASYALVGAAVIFALKYALAMPRPPEELFLVPLPDDPYGFPSGHAFIAVVVYGGTLLSFELERDWRAVAGVGILVLLISLSRIVLGFHYLGDIVAGAAIGIVFLLAMRHLTDGDPRRGFAIGLAVGAPAVVVTGPEPEVLLSIGGAVGGLLAAWNLEWIPDLRSRAEAAVLVLVGAVVLVGGTLLADAVGPNPIAGAAVYAVIVAGVLLAPAGVGRIDAGPIVGGAGGGGE